MRHGHHIIWPVCGLFLWQDHPWHQLVLPLLQPLAAPPHPGESQALCEHLSCVQAVRGDALVEASAFGETDRQDDSPELSFPEKPKQIIKPCRK